MTSPVLENFSSQTRPFSEYVKPRSSDINVDVNLKTSQFNERGGQFPEVSKRIALNSNQDSELTHLKRSSFSLDNVVYSNIIDGPTGRKLKIRKKLKVRGRPSGLFQSVTGLPYKNQKGNKRKRKEKNHSKKNQHT